MGCVWPVVDQKLCRPVLCTHVKTPYLRRWCFIGGVAGGGCRVTLSVVALFALLFPLRLSHDLVKFEFTDLMARSPGAFNRKGQNQPSIICAGKSQWGYLGFNCPAIDQDSAGGERKCTSGNTQKNISLEQLGSK